MTRKILNIIKHRIFKITSTIVIVMMLGWGISSFAEDDIKSATLNFSVMGIVSEVTDKDLKVIDAKGSNNSGVTTYDLNISYLEKIETNKKDVLDISNIKPGDKIIAQGLTNGSTFFIKRIISFSSSPIDQVKSNATSTEVVADIATTTESSDFSSSTNSGTSENPDENDSSQDNKIVDVPTSDSSSTSTDEISTTTSTTTDEVSTTTEDSATTTSVVETVVDVVEAVVDTIKDIIDNVLDTLTGDNSTSTESVVDVSVDIENNDSSNQNEVVQSPEPVIETSSDVTTVSE